MAPKGWLPWVRARRATSNDRRRNSSSSSDVVIFEMLSMAVPLGHHADGGCDKQAGRSVPRHVPSDFREVGFAGAGFIVQLAVKHHHQTIRQFEQLVEI